MKSKSRSNEFHNPIHLTHAQQIENSELREYCVPDVEPKVASPCAKTLVVTFKMEYGRNSVTFYMTVSL